MRGIDQELELFRSEQWYGPHKRTERVDDIVKEKPTGDHYHKNGREIHHALVARMKIVLVMLFDLLGQPIDFPLSEEPSDGLPLRWYLLSPVHLCCLDGGFALQVVDQLVQ